MPTQCRNIEVIYRSIEAYTGKWKSLNRNCVVSVVHNQCRKYLMECILFYVRISFHYRMPNTFCSREKPNRNEGETKTRFTKKTKCLHRTMSLWSMNSIGKQQYSLRESKQKSSKIFKLHIVRPDICLTIRIVSLYKFMWHEFDPV